MVSEAKVYTDSFRTPSYSLMLIAAIATAIVVKSELPVGKATKSTNYMMAIAARANPANANVEPPYHT